MASDDEGRCRFNCMTGRETWEAAIHALIDEFDLLRNPHRLTMAELEGWMRPAYRKWRKEQRD